MITSHHPDAISEKREPTQPESPLPEEFFRRLRCQTTGQGAQRLAVAVLEDALRSFARSHGARGFVRRRLYWEAEQWIRSRDSGPVFSFENVCSILELDADELRRQLQLWCARRLQGPMPAFLELSSGRMRHSKLRLVLPISHLVHQRVPEG